MMDIIKKIVVPSILLRALREYDAKQYGIKIGSTLRDMLNDEFGSKKAKYIKDTIEPWIAIFAKTLIRELNKED